MTNEEAIEQIMDYFQFDRVLKAMEALGWVWDCCNGIPDMPLVRCTARSLLKEVANLPYGTTVETGGFSATHEEPGCFTLRFLIDEWTTVE